MWIKQLAPDEKTLAVISESTRRVLIGDALTGTIKHTLPAAAMFSSSERGVLFVSDGVKAGDRVPCRLFDQRFS